jgi:hypothetical protein
LSDNDDPKWLHDWKQLETDLESPAGQVATSSQDAAEEKNGGGENKGELGKDDQHGTSADFAALIDAIKREGAAYRKEEQREDSGKKFREWVTIVLIAFTFAAVCWQVREMMRVYEPISDQAKATAKSAEATASSQRAWVGPSTVTLNGIQKDKGMIATIAYQNSGREPAVSFYPGTATKLYSLEEWNGGDATKEIMAESGQCLKINNLPSGLQVVYPTTGFSAYQLTIDTEKLSEANKILVTDDIISGKSIATFKGCFSYKTAKEIHHSAFCFYYLASATTLPNLSICNVGNEAD